MAYGEWIGGEQHDQQVQLMPMPVNACNETMMSLVLGSC